MEKYIVINHASDIGLIAYGKTLEELFENVVFGLFSLITDLEKVEPKEEFKVVSYGDDLESLVITCLNDFIFLYDSKKVLLSQFEVKTIGNNKAQFYCHGERIDISKHNLNHSIKAATFNQLKIDKNQDIYSVKVVFDV